MGDGNQKPDLKAEVIRIRVKIKQKDGCVYTWNDRNEILSTKYRMIGIIINTGEGYGANLLLMCVTLRLAST